MSKQYLDKTYIKNQLTAINDKASLIKLPDLSENTTIHANNTNTPVKIICLSFIPSRHFFIIISNGV